MVKALIVILLLLSQVAQATVTASLDRNQIMLNETATLSIQSDESHVFASPDVQALAQNFIVENQGKSSQSSWINGKSQSSTTWRYVLKPKQVGVFTIDPIELDGEKTEPLSLKVTQTQYQTSNNQGPIFLEVSVDKKQVHVGQQIVLRIKVNRAVAVSDLRLDPPAVSQAKVNKLNETQYQRQINGKTYVTHEISYSIFPEQSGQLLIPALHLTAIVPNTEMDLFMQQGKAQYFASQPISVEVDAALATLNADSFNLTESWSKDPGSLQVGDSITRTISQKAAGSLAQNLADIHIEPQQAMRVYAQKPELKNQVINQSNAATRTDNIALVFTHEGDITLPAINIDWFDNQSQSQKTASLPAITLHIAKNPNLPTQKQASQAMQEKPKSIIKKTTTEPAANAKAPVEKAPSSLIIWQASCALLLLLSLVLAFFMLKKKSAAKIEPSVNTLDEAFKALTASYKTHDPQNIKKQLLLWAKLRWPNQAVHSLADIKRLLNQAELESDFKKLDKNQLPENWSLFITALKQEKAKDNGSIYPTH